MGVGRVWESLGYSVSLVCVYLTWMLRMCSPQEVSSRGREMNELVYTRLCPSAVVTHCMWKR